MNLSRVKLTSRKSLVAVAIVIVLAITCLGGWLVWYKSQNTVDPVVVPESLDEVLSKGMEYSDKGNVDEGLAYYDSQIEEREDDSEKQQLLIYKSTFALEASRPEVAVESAKQADAIESNTASLMALALAFESEGNNEQAISYYKKLIESLPAEENMESRYRGEWEQKIEELQN